MNIQRYSSRDMISMYYDDNGKFVTFFDFDSLRKEHEREIAALRTQLSEPGLLTRLWGSVKRMVGR